MVAVSTINYPNRNFHKTEDWTSTKIKQVALYFFALILIFAAIAACLMISSPYNLLPAAAGVPILGIVGSARQIKDYHNPEKLKQYRAEAAEMSFQKIHDVFGLKNAIRYELVSLDTLKNKFNKQIQEMDFCSVLKAYSLSDLSIVATHEHIKLLKNLKIQEAQFRAKYAATNHSPQARSQFHRGVNRLEEEYNRFKATYLP